MSWLQSLKEWAKRLKNKLLCFGLPQGILKCRGYPKLLR